MIKKMLLKFHKKPSSNNSENQEKNDNSDENFNGFSTFSSYCSTTGYKERQSGKPNSVLRGGSFYGLSSCGDCKNKICVSVMSKRLGTPKGAKVGPVGEKLGCCEGLPRFEEVPSSEKVDLFVKKLNLCCAVYDFSDPIEHLKEKDVKRESLHELVDFMTCGSLRYDEVLVQEIVKMVSANLFRTICASYRDNRFRIGVYYGEEEEYFMEPSWPHLEVVYDFFFRFVSSMEMDENVAKKYIDQSFVSRLLNLFDAEDKRERESLKKILHKIYGKFTVHRPFIRKIISSIFYDFIFLTEKHNGIADLLEILGSIIEGFDLPLKEEHKILLVRALIPLHKPKCVLKYHQQLSRCIMLFVEKDLSLAYTLIHGLLKYWPISNASKEVVFLDELEAILEATTAMEFQHSMVPLFHQIGRCIGSSQFQVADRALYMWNNDRVRNFILENRRIILPIILPFLERSSRSHWHQAIQSMSFNLKELFCEFDQELFDECSIRIQVAEINEVAAKEKHALTWKRLEDMAASKAVFESGMTSSPLIATKYAQ